MKTTPHEALNSLRLPKTPQEMRGRIFRVFAGAIIAFASLDSTSCFAAENGSLENMGLEIAKGRAVQNGLKAGGSITYRCREPGDPIVTTNSGYGYGPGNSTIYLPPDHPECRDDARRGQ